MQIKDTPSKERKYMSSKQLYFLPLIKNVKISNKTSISYQKMPTYQYKSIQSIIEKKDSQNTTTEKYDSILLANKSAKITDNLYNKYQSLPKIYKQRNRKQNSKNQVSQLKNFMKKHLKSDDNEQTKIDDDGSYLKNKENSFNFNDLYYKEHFNRRLQEETQKIEFKLSYNYSEKEFLGVDVLQDDTNLSQRKKHPVKYTKIDLSDQLTDPQISTLEKVPDFLMRLLQPHKSIATA